MNTADSISDFIELYLSIDLPKKDKELLKARVASRGKSNDELKKTVETFKKTLSKANSHFLSTRSKTEYSLPEHLENILHLSPEDFFLLVAACRYQIDEETLSLILSQPKESLRFRLEQLKERLSITDDKIKNLHKELALFETKRFSQLIKIKNALAPRRFLSETVMVMGLLVLVLWSIPMFQTRYEKWVDKKTSEYFVNKELQDAPISEELNKKSEPILTDADTIDPQVAIEKIERKQPKATSGEVWRFSFTGSAKINLETEMKQILQKYTEEVPKVSLAPGGAQYTSPVKTERLIDLKIELEAIVDSQPTLKMSWYKKKSMASKKIPAGHVEVIIWISNI